jgi:glycyl-tRNA synthetase beta chain
MTEVRDLLIEIGTEELPPRALLRLAQSFAEQIRTLLTAQNLGHKSVEQYATPRRLAVVVRSLSAKQPDTEQVRRGPAVSAAFNDEGKPTQAALGFAKSCGVALEALERQDNGKGAWLVYRNVRPGRSAVDLLPNLVTTALDKLPIPKRMRWGDRAVSFVRPVHWVCMVFGDECVAGRVMDMAIGRETRGHRFHDPGPFPVRTASDYGAMLRAAKVEPDFARRRDSIVSQVEGLARSVGGEATTPADLLDEVTALCEWPVALLGQFDERFLGVPAEALIETMQQHQKYFAVRSAAGELMPYFVAVANIDSVAPDFVRAGNERVIRPRFSDAQFFWQQDLRTPLADFAPALEHVVFHHKLGSVADKSRRVVETARTIGASIGGDPDLVERAALLSKCDLVTAMVGEFAGLQGIMGRYYAEHSGEDACICAAMEEQYLPRHAGDRLPVSPCGIALSCADKIDTLLGIFAVGERPTGDKDPYGLRRAAIGVLRILIETPVPLDLRGLLRDAAKSFPPAIAAGGAVSECYAYIMERLRSYYAEQGIVNESVEAVMAVDASMPSDFDRRVRAVHGFSELEAAAALAAANKRIENILRKSGTNTAARELRAERLVDAAEQALAASVGAMEARIEPLVAVSDYSSALAALAQMRAQVDRFFDEVLVMDEDPELRNNRLALLQRVRDLFCSIADVSKLRHA